MAAGLLLLSACLGDARHVIVELRSEREIAFAQLAVAVTGLRVR